MKTSTAVGIGAGAVGLATVVGLLLAASSSSAASGSSGQKGKAPPITPPWQKGGGGQPQPKPKESKAPPLPKGATPQRVVLFGDGWGVSLAKTLGDVVAPAVVQPASSVDMTIAEAAPQLSAHPDVLATDYLLLSLGNTEAVKTGAGAQVTAADVAALVAAAKAKGARVIWLVPPTLNDPSKLTMANIQLLDAINKGMGTDASTNVWFAPADIVITDWQTGNMSLADAQKWATAIGTRLNSLGVQQAKGGAPSAAQGLYSSMGQPTALPLPPAFGGPPAVQQPAWPSDAEVMIHRLLQGKFYASTIFAKKNPGCLSGWQPIFHMAKMCGGGETAIFRPQAWDWSTSRYMVQQGDSPIGIVNLYGLCLDGAHPIHQLNAINGNQVTLNDGTTNAAFWFVGQWLNMPPLALQNATNFAAVTDLQGCVRADDGAEYVFHFKDGSMHKMIGSGGKFWPEGVIGGPITPKGHRFDQTGGGGGVPYSANLPAWVKQGHRSLPSSLASLPAWART